MPRCFIDALGAAERRDEEGHVLTDQAAARRLAGRALAEMMRDYPELVASTLFRADVRDESGRRLVTATLLMVVEDAD